MKTIYWVTRDLRLDDNPCLQASSRDQSLLCVYCVDPRSFSPYRYHTAQLGPHRWNFLQQSLSDFNSSLLQLGQRLLVKYADTVESLSSLIEKHGVDRLVCARQVGFDERQILARLKAKFPRLAVEEYDAGTLLNLGELPFPVGEIPETYSRFRRKVEKQALQGPRAPVSSLPPPPTESIAESLQRPDWVPATVVSDCPFDGGETAAVRHLAGYLSGAAPLSYKQTRNALEGFDTSAKLSPWLADGSLSPRRALARIRDYEDEHGGNESTYWLFIELLWREYFQWLALKIGQRLFAFRGSASSRPLTAFHGDRFQAWCMGNTPYPLVNACMNELRHTGFMSNRGRQIAASCLIHELGLDWRYGAAWFEHQLVDYDVASNWGNWQYIAGVGADPRGGRHFNLAKQAEIYDPDGSYTRRWAPNPAPSQLDSRDAADWPVD